MGGSRLGSDSESEMSGKGWTEKRSDGVWEMRTAQRNSRAILRQEAENSIRGVGFRPQQEERRSRLRWRRMESK